MKSGDRRESVCVFPALLPAGAGRRFPFSPGRASSFRHRPKGTKGRLRGCASGSASAPKGGASLTVGPPPKDPRFYGSAELMPVSTDRRTVSTLCAPLGGLRPGATKHAALLRRLWAPGAGVQACGSAPLTAHTPKCPAWPGAPVGWDSRSIRLHEPGGRRGKLGNRGSRTPEREGCSPTERGGIPKGGMPPFGRAFGDFLRVQKVTPAERRPRRPQAAESQAD